MVKLPHWPKLQASINQANYMPGTERVLKLLNFFNNPHLYAPPTIYVAGTNGKGSTLSYMRSILEKSGYTVSTFTSPHIINYNERIIIKGSEISDSELFILIEECRIASETLGIIPTFFEVSTVVAFLSYAKNRSDFLIIEVGMGGKLDATNVIESPILSAITSISKDHQEFLGDTLSSITMEKVGIIKENSICVTSNEIANVKEIIKNYCKIKKTSAHCINEEWNIKKLNEEKLLFTNEEENIILDMPSLIGDHQVENAGIAVASIVLLRKKINLKIENKNISEGLKSTRWIARLEKIDYPSIKEILNNKNWSFYMDGAHNVDGAHKLSNWLKKFPSHKKYALVGLTRPKDPTYFIEALKDNVDFLCGICVNQEFKAHRGEDIANSAKKIGLDSKAFDYFNDALEYISKTEKSEKVIIVACGSLYIRSDIERYNKQGSLI